MQYFKKLLCLVLCTALVFTLPGCSKGKEESSQKPASKESGSPLPTFLSGKGGFVSLRLDYPEIPEEGMPEGFEVKTDLSVMNLHSVFPDPLPPHKPVCIFSRSLRNKENKQQLKVPYFFYLEDENWVPVEEDVPWAAASRQLFNEPAEKYGIEFLGTDEEGNLYYYYLHYGGLDTFDASLAKTLVRISPAGELSNVSLDVPPDVHVGNDFFFSGCYNDTLLGKKDDVKTGETHLIGFGLDGSCLFHYTASITGNILIWQDSFVFLQYTSSGTELIFLNMKDGAETRKLDVTDIAGRSNLSAGLYNDDVLLLTGPRGLFAMSYGAESWEQLLDSEHAPSGQFMSALDSSRFLTFNIRTDSFYLYQYDEDFSSDVSVTVFALPDTGVSSPLRTSTLQYAAQEYMLKHPDVSIQITTTQEDKGGNAEDTIKALNTRLLAGQGEDILLLDGLPYEDFIEKGCLADISALAAECSLCPQGLTDPFTAGSRIYGLPSRITVPVLQGDPEDLKGISDIFSLAAAVQRIRQESPEISPFFLNDPYALAEVFYPVCAPAWFNREGQFQEEAFREFLEAVNLLSSSAECRKAKAGDADDWSGQVPDSLKDGSTNEGKPRPVYYVTDFDYPLFFFVNYAYLTHDKGLNNQKKRFETFLLRPGQLSGAYLPSRIFALNKNSKNTEAAKDFIRFALTDPGIQTAQIFDGLPVKKESLRKFFEPFFYSDSSGSPNRFIFAQEQSVSLEEEDLDAFVDWCEENLTTPCVSDSRLSDIILPEVKKYLEGTQSLSQTVSQVKQKTALYQKE